MELCKLFYECAYKGGWTTINNVDFKFIEHDNTLEIHFMGSSQFSDWIFNFFFPKKLYKMFKVHRGFYHCYSQVRSIILDKIYKDVDKYKEIIIVGYSHGSALTIISHEDIGYHFPNIKVRSYAFESPRPLKVKKKYKHLWNGLTRIVNGNDIVCHLPPRIFGFSDVGNEIKIKGDTSLVDKCLPKCIKSHFPNVVYDGLKKFEQEKMLNGGK